jgi:hypothetical protein
MNASFTKIKKNKNKNKKITNYFSYLIIVKSPKEQRLTKISIVRGPFGFEISKSTI